MRSVVPKTKKKRTVNANCILFKCKCIRSMDTKNKLFKRIKKKKRLNK